MNSSLEGQTKMVNAPKTQTKLVKIKANTAIRLTKDGVEEIITEGKVVEVSEEDAREYCDREFNLGYKDTFGNFDPHSVKPKVIRRAVRV